MTFICAPILAGDVESALADARQARAMGADLVEFRVDHLFHGEHDDEGERAVLELVRESPLPCIVTCRPTYEGGDYDGDEASRIALFERLAALGAGAGGTPPRYVDIELAALERSANLRQKALLAVEHPDQPRELATSMILSMHDFKGRPAGLLRTLERMRREPAAKVLKIAWMARSLRDNLEILDLVAERDRPMIALAMGAAGLMSRVLAPKFGAFLTFASVRPAAVTAPGQPTIEDLLTTYRFRAINPATRVYGVIGWPVEHSLSPLVHNAGFGALDPDGPGFNGVYLPLLVAPEWEPLKATLGALVDHERLDFAGGSVTIPHKEHALRFARERSQEGWVVDRIATIAGAVNTLVRLDGPAVRAGAASAPSARWLATNTDAPAVAACARSALGDNLAGRRIAIIGAGGAARAAAAGLAEAGANVSLLNRTMEKCGRLAAELNVALATAGLEAPPISAAPIDDLERTSWDMIINCTPVGMRGGPAPDSLPLDESILDRIGPDTVVFDTVYTPRLTPLLRAARERGLRTIEGANMLVHQAEAQFQLWTGRGSPEGLFARIVRERLNADSGNPA